LAQGAFGLFCPRCPLSPDTGRCHPAAMPLPLMLPGAANPAGISATRAPDHKTELTVVLQRLVGRTLTKGDVAYEVAAVDSGFQATVKLVCLAGEEYAGEVCPTEKAAEHAAANQALLVNAEAVAALPPSNKPPRRGKAKAAPGVRPPGPGPMQAEGNMKTELVNRLQMHCSRTMTKPDIVYEVSELAGQFQASVKLMCLEIPQEYMGHAGATEKAAEHSAAEMALMEQATWSLPAAVAPPALVAVPANGQKARQAPSTSQGANHKTELTTVLQKICGRTLTKHDVVYTVTEEGEQHLAYVKLVCLEGYEYVGQPSATAKAAEHSAAQQAVMALSAQAALAPPSKRMTQAAAGMGKRPRPPTPMTQATLPQTLQTAGAPRNKGPRVIQPLGFLPGGRPFGVETLHAS